MKNKKILIIGASSGIGRATAIYLAQKGANLVLISRNEGKLQKLISECEGNNHHFAAIDVLDLEKLETFINKHSIESGIPFDGFVYSAGVEGTVPLKFLKKEALENILNVNVTPAVVVSKILLKKGVFTKEGGSFVFISSVMGSLGQPAKIAYCMSKGALVSAMKAMALELAEKRIRVNCISPGMVVTEMSSKILDSISDDSKKEIEKMHPLGIGNVQDIANGIEFLLSDKSKWITGIDLLIDGGYSAQ
jgi:NAD(P)-dependent dehydrogenase (short-subunit alcohol dehydrogenase family)